MIGVCGVDVLFIGVSSDPFLVRYPARLNWGRGLDSFSMMFQDLRGSRLSDVGV